MDQETRSLIELLRDETQSRSVFERCNAVLAAASVRDTGESTEDDRWSKFITEWNARKYEEWIIRQHISTITATEAEVEIITGEKR